MLVNTSSTIEIITYRVEYFNVNPFCVVSPVTSVFVLYWCWAGLIFIYPPIRQMPSFEDQEVWPHLESIRFMLFLVAILKQLDPSSFHPSPSPRPPQIRLPSPVCHILGLSSLTSTIHDDLVSRFIISNVSNILPVLPFLPPATSNPEIINHQSVPGNINFKA